MNIYIVIYNWWELFKIDYFNKYDKLVESSHSRENENPGPYK